MSDWRLLRQWYYSFPLLEGSQCLVSLGCKGRLWFLSFIEAGNRGAATFVLELLVKVSSLSQLSFHNEGKELGRTVLGTPF